MQKVSVTYRGKWRYSSEIWWLYEYRKENIKKVKVGIYVRGGNFWIRKNMVLKWNLWYNQVSV